MLRRALAGHHHHPLCIVHSQRLSRATATLLSSAPPDSQNSTSARHQPFSTSRVCRLRKGGASKKPPRRLGNSQNSPSHVVGTSGGPSQPSSPPIPEAAQADTSGGDDVRVPDPDVVVGNSTNKKRVLRGDDGDHAAQGEASPAQANRASTRPRTTHTRTRALRPLVFPPSFPPIPLLPTTNAPITDQDQGEQKATADDKTDAAGSSSSSTTIAVGALPPDTLKTDIRSVFQPFGEVKRIFVHPGGRRADVVFADVESVRRVLHAYAEQPLCVRGHEVVVFRRRHHHARSAGVNGRGAVASRRPFYVQHEQDDDDGAKEAKEGVVFVSNFPAGTTQEELSKVLAPLGKYEHFVMRPGSRYAYFMYSSDDSVENILRVHERVPITFRGQPLRIERTKNRPYNSSTESEEPLVELEKPTSNALVEELKKTVPGWKGSCGPSRVLWVGRLPHDIPREALTNFWSRLGCVVEVRASTNGFAHVEFASVEEATRAARKGVPHGFRYEDRLLDVDFAPWVFYVGPLYRSVYISGWSASKGRAALLRWASDIPNIIGATVPPPFRGEKRSAPRGAFLHFRSTDDAQVALRALDGRKAPRGSGSETLLRVTLSRISAVHPDRLWRWANAEERGSPEDESEWAGLGFGTGQESSSSSSVGTGKTRRQGGPPGTRGGRRLGVWKEPGLKAAAEWDEEDEEEDTPFSHPLWTGAGGEGGGGEKGPRLLRTEIEREVEEGLQVAQRAFLRRLLGRRGRPTNGDSG